MDYKQLILNDIKNIDSEYLLKIIYRFIRGLMD